MDIHTLNVGISNSYLIRDQGTILIDAGVPGRIKKFEYTLKNLGIAPEEIAAIAITHCHWDHVGSLKELRNITGAKVIAHKNDADHLEKGELIVPPGVTWWGKY